MTLDWRYDSWRVAPAATWPQLTRRRTGERPGVVPPDKPAPACRHCDRPCHLTDDDGRPTHKVCAEAALPGDGPPSPGHEPYVLEETQ